MSSREMAHKILDNMNEEQIIGFITKREPFYDDAKKIIGIV